MACEHGGALGGLLHPPRRRHCRALYPLLLPYRERNILQGTPACYGSAHRYLGLLAGTMRRWEDAERHYAAAAQAHASWGAAPFLARGQYEHARCWWRATIQMTGSGRELLRPARHEAERLGMSQLAHHVQALTAQLHGQEAGGLTSRNRLAELARIERSPRLRSPS